jgi:DNA-binding HxlR family transcriptional regulator
MITYKEKNYLCLLDFGMDFVRGKWKSLILCNLYNEPARFLELQRLLSGVSQKVLTDNLKALEDAELITKTVHPEIPPRVEYSLTPMGIDFTKALRTIEEWSAKYYSHLNNTNIE